jgi:hypothetical protein
VSAFFEEWLTQKQKHEWSPFPLISSFASGAGNRMGRAFLVPASAEFLNRR